MRRYLFLLPLLLSAPAFAQAVPEGWALGAIAYEGRMDALQDRPAEAGAPRIARFVWTGEGEAGDLDDFPFAAACEEIARFLASMGGESGTLRIEAGITRGDVIRLSRSYGRSFEVVGGRCLSDEGTDL